MCITGESEHRRITTEVMSQNDAKGSMCRNKSIGIPLKVEPVSTGDFIFRQCLSEFCNLKR